MAATEQKNEGITNLSSRQDKPEIVSEETKKSALYNTENVSSLFNFLAADKSRAGVNSGEESSIDISLTGSKSSKKNRKDIVVKDHVDSDSGEDFLMDIAPKCKAGEKNEEFLDSALLKKSRNVSQRVSTSSSSSVLKSMKNEISSNANSIQRLLRAANKRKDLKEEYETFTKKIKGNDQKEKSSSGTIENSLEKFGLESDLIVDAKEELEPRISILQDPGHNLLPIFCSSDIWNNSRLGSLVASDLLKNDSLLFELISTNGLFDWISLFWQAPFDILEVLWRKVPSSMNVNPDALNDIIRELKMVAEYLNWPEIQSETILNIFQLVGVPKNLLNLDEDFDLSLYIKYDSLTSEVASSIEKSDHFALQISCFLRILKELVKCVRFNYESIAQFLVIMSMISMNHNSGLFNNDLFDCIVVLVELSEDIDWNAIASTWTRKLFQILGKHTLSEQAFIFFDGCMQQYSCSRLCAWGKATTLNLLVSLQGEAVSNSIEIDLHMNPISVLKILEHVLSKNVLFTVSTPSYKKTHRAINFLRYQLHREIILNNAECKSLSRQIVKKLTSFHNKIDDRMALFLDRSIVKDELLRLSYSIDLILEPIASRKQDR